MATLSAFGVITLSLVSTGSLPASALGPFTTVTVDSTDNVGEFISLALNSSGFPVISYRDVTNADLKIAVCGDAACTTSTRTTVDKTDGTDSVGWHTSLALNSAGFPVISYYDITNADLKVAVCGNATCGTTDTPVRTLTTVDSTGSVGQFTSLALNSSGSPVISYWDETNLDLKVAVCGNATCGTTATPVRTLTTVDSTDSVGRHTSLALNGSGSPVISYNDATNLDLKVAVCGDATCGTTATPVRTLTTVDSTDTVGVNNSLELNDSGFPVISYSDITRTDLKVAVCGNATCGTTAAPVRTLTTVDSTDSVGRYTSLALNGSGFPVISYYDVTNADLKVAVCGDTTCGTTAAPVRTLTIVDSTDSVGFDTSLALNSSGLPVISYNDITNADLKVASVPVTAATIDAYTGAAAASAPTPDAPDAVGASPSAAAAKLGWPTSMAFDAAGNLYFTDRYNHTVRRVAADGGAVTTIAGTPGVRCPVTTDPCGDGGPPASANLRSPWGIAVDTATPPNVFISDYGNHRIRMVVASANVIITIAGTGIAGDVGDGQANTHQLNYPSGLTLDADGSLLVADRGNHRIRKIDDGGNMTTFLGTGAPGSSATSCSTLGTTVCTLDQPTDIKVRGSSDIPSTLSTTDFFIADRNNHAVLATRDGGADGIIADRIGTGIPDYDDGDPGTAQFNQPLSLAHDALHQELYIADSNNLRVRRYSAVSQNTTTVAGNGTGKLGNSPYVTPTNGGAAGTTTALNFPIGVAFLPTGTQNQGTAYVTAVYENQIRRLDISQGDLF
jgi:secreted trypsin-like serine protease